VIEIAEAVGLEPIGDDRKQTGAASDEQGAGF